MSGSLPDQRLLSRPAGSPGRSRRPARQRLVPDSYSFGDHLDQVCSEKGLAMRLARSPTAPGAVVPVAGYGERWFDLTSFTADIRPETLSPGSLTGIRAAIDAGLLPETGAPERYAPPLATIGKIVCVGLNYTDHAAETGATPPSEPILFMKAPDTVVGPDDEVLIPRKSVKTDYEVELAVVLGRTARYLDSPSDARAYVAGYAISNDVSEREFQNERQGLWVNEDLRQDGSTKNMIFNVDHLVWYISQFMTLYPGDVINTGTPAGVALGRKDQPFLRAGDVVRIEADRLGRQRQTFAPA